MRKHYPDTLKWWHFIECQGGFLISFSLPPLCWLMRTACGSPVTPVRYHLRRMSTSGWPLSAGLSFDATQGAVLQYGRARHFPFAGVVPR